MAEVPARLADIRARLAGLGTAVTEAVTPSPLPSPPLSPMTVPVETIPIMESPLAQTKTWYQNPWVWVIAAIAIAAIGLFLWWRYQKRKQHQG